MTKEDRKYLIFIFLIACAAFSYYSSNESFLVKTVGFGLIVIIYALYEILAVLWDISYKISAANSHSE